MCRAYGPTGSSRATETRSSPAAFAGCIEPRRRSCSFPTTPSRSYGGAFASGGASVDNTDFHQLEEDRFAAEAAAMLRTRALANAFETLIIVAPPKTLGELRKHYHKEVEQRISGEIAKDLTGHPVDQIEKILIAHP